MPERPEKRSEGVQRALKKVSASRARTPRAKGTAALSEKEAIDIRQGNAPFPAPVVQSAATLMNRYLNNMLVLTDLRRTKVSEFEKKAHADEHMEKMEALARKCKEESRQLVELFKDTAQIDIAVGAKYTASVQSGMSKEMAQTQADQWRQEIRTMMEGVSSGSSMGLASQGRSKSP